MSIAQFPSDRVAPKRKSGRGRGRGKQPQGNKIVANTVVDRDQYLAGLRYRLISDTAQYMDGMADISDDSFVQMLKMLSFVGISDRDVADELGVAPTTVYRWRSALNLPHVLARSTIVSRLVIRLKSQARVLAELE